MVYELHLVFIHFVLALIHVRKDTSSQQAGCSFPFPTLWRCWLRCFVNVQRFIHAQLVASQKPIKRIGGD